MKNKTIIALIIFIMLSIYIGFQIYDNYIYDYDELYINGSLANKDSNIDNYTLNVQDGNAASNSNIVFSKIKVHIIGEINNPGLYELDKNSRIDDLIKLAGGETEKADLNKVNLAYELCDGEKIRIPSILDEDLTYIYNDAGENVVSSESASSGSTKKINLNKATTNELQTISGIGPSLAEKIIDYRNSNGKFRSIEDLKNISGIGDKKFEIIKKYVTVFHINCIFCGKSLDFPNTT